MQLEGRAQAVDHLLLDDALGGQQLGKPAERGRLAHVSQFSNGLYGVAFWAPGGDARRTRVAEQLEQEGVGGTFAADARLIPVTREHDDVVGEREHLVTQAAQHRRMVTPGEVGAPDRALEQQVAGEHQLRDRGLTGLLAVRRAEGHRSLGVAGRVVDGELQTGQLEGLQVGELGDVVGLGELVLPAEQHACGVGRHAGHRVGEQMTVARVDPRRRVVRPGDGRHAPHVVDVAVGDQHRHRLEVVLADDLGDPLGRVLARVDHHALGTRQRWRRRSSWCPTARRGSLRSAQCGAPVGLGVCSRQADQGSLSRSRSGLRHSDLRAATHALHSQRGHQEETAAAAGAGQRAAPAGAAGPARRTTPSAADRDRHGGRRPRRGRPGGLDQDASLRRRVRPPRGCRAR